MTRHDVSTFVFKHHHNFNTLAKVPVMLCPQDVMLRDSTARSDRSSLLLGSGSGPPGQVTYKLIW